MKLLSIVFLSLACLINLGHSLFPHTHTKEHQHNGRNHHHHDEHSYENGLSVLFSHFSHSLDTFSNSHLEDVIQISKEIPYQQIIVWHNYSNYSNPLGFSNKKELVRNKEPLIFISPHLHSLQFRGPPTTLS